MEARGIDEQYGQCCRPRLDSARVKTRVSKVVEFDAYLVLRILQKVQWGRLVIIALQHGQMTSLQMNVIDPATHTHIAN